MAEICVTHTLRPMVDRPRIIVWADARQSDLVRDVADRAALALIAVGAEDDDEGTSLSRSLGVEHVHDIRQAIQHPEADLFWIATDETIGPEALRLIQARGVRTVTSQPIPASMSEALDAPADAAVRFVPLMRRSDGFRAAEDVFESFGERHAVAIQFLARPGESSLFSRLFDAMDILESVCGTAEQIDASLISPFGSTPDELVDLEGTITANVRFSDQRCAAVTVSDQAGRWSRGVTVLGDGGCLRITDHTFEWIDRDGRTTEEDSPPPDSAGGCARAVAGHIQHLIRERDSRTPAPDSKKLLALCEATRLSCRTAEAESPRKMLEMLKRP